MVKNSGMRVPVWKSGQQQKEAAGVESHRRLKVRGLSSAFCFFIVVCLFVCLF